MSNPLLTLKHLPQFSDVKPEHIEPALDVLLKHNREQLQALLKQSNFNWGTLIQPLEDMSVALSRMWSVVSHLNNVVNTPELRDVYNKCLPKLTEYATELEHNVELYRAYLAIAESPAYNDLTKAKQRVIQHALRDFRLAGVALAPEKKQRFKDIQQKLALLQAKFEENLLDATDGWSKLITDEKQLIGLPSHSLQSAKSAAIAKNLEGWLFNLEFPSYYAVVTFAENQDLRKEFYTAYSTRASDQGPYAGKWDNSAIMAEILALRHEEAQLVDFNNYAEYSLATKMAKKPQKVLDFLHELAKRAKPVAEKEFQELMQFAKQFLELETLNPWDIAYSSEKLRHHKHAISQEQLRPYFPIEQVLAGLFKVAEKLYGITITENIFDANIWHKDVRYFEVRNVEKRVIAGFYLDLYARGQKRGGAWMDACSDRHRDQHQRLQLPLAFLCCNFTPPTDASPALLTHEEVVTLFHEFGHGLQQMLTQVDIASIAGINGIEWDAVEFPSQFMENWCWQKEVIPLMSSHYQTKERLPEELFEKLSAAKNFQTGMQTVRQLEFALFDFRIHLEFDPQQGDRIQTILNEVRKQIAVVPIARFNRFQHSFAHIFGGGYAAGYYSYKWAEVLACDAFSQFEKNGIFDQETGQRFLHSILETGASADPMELFISFQGREPELEALLKHDGLL